MKHHGAPLFSSMWVRAKGQIQAAAHTDFDLSANDRKPVHSVIGQLWDLSVSLPNSAHAFSWASDLCKARVLPVSSESSSRFGFGLQPTCFCSPPSQAGQWPGPALPEAVMRDHAVLRCNEAVALRSAPFRLGVQWSNPGRRELFRNIPSAAARVRKGQQHARSSGCLGIPHTCCDCRRKRSQGCWCRGRSL